MAFGASVTILRIEMVMGRTGVQMPEFRDQYSHSNALTLRLVKPWLHSGRVVCGDSYFASVQTAEALLKYGMNFIGVVKNATKNFRWSTCLGRNFRPVVITCQLSQTSQNTEGT